MNSRGHSFLGTFALVFASMAGLFVFDAFLERAEIAESRAEAERLFTRGEQLQHEGRYGPAIEEFRSALTFARQNVGYQLALSRALLAAGKFSDADAAAAAVLAGDPSKGEANLTMARILVKEGRLADAGSYYHRAIYGRWGGDAAKRRLDVQLELIDLLARENDKQQLLAELLPLQDEKLNIGTRERIAKLYLQAGSPSRAFDMYRAILKERPSDPGAFAGLGEAEFARGNYKTAHTEFLIASHLLPRDAELRKRLDLSSEVLALDPASRGLGARQRYERSYRLLDMAIQGLQRCKTADIPVDAQALLDTAQAALAVKVKPGGEDEAANTNVDLAEKVWQTRKRICSQAVSDAEQPLALVLAKLAQ